MKALVTGATGFIGRELIKRLEAPPRPDPHPRECCCQRTRSTDVGLGAHCGSASAGCIRWRGHGVSSRRRSCGQRPLDGGEEIQNPFEPDRRYPPPRTRTPVDALAALEKRPACLVSASAVGYYGDRADEILDENSSADGSFLSEVCQEWEREASRGEEYGIRVVTIRTGIVLGEGGGALEAMLPPFKLGFGGRLGSGHQWMPWIHIGDLVRLMLHSAVANDLRGPVNGVSPNPVTNRDFTRTLARTLHRPALFPAPGSILRLALGEFALVLLGITASDSDDGDSVGFRVSIPRAGRRPCRDPQIGPLSCLHRECTALLCMERSAMGDNTYYRTGWPSLVFKV